jgi:predicted O-methyltransferase YrrM
VIVIFLWGEGRRQIQFQRPRGIVFAEWLILCAINVVFASAFFGRFVGVPGGRITTLVCVLGAAMGIAVIAKVVPPFMKKGAEYHRILDHLVEQGDAVQKEYTPPTPECPNPQLWNMVDSQTTELEVLDFLKALVIAVKPRLIVETGTFLGYGTIKLAEGAKANGFGRVVTVEYDPALFEKARERVQAAGLGEWVECRNESSLTAQIDGDIDFYFSDSALAMREQEIRRLLPQVDPRGIIAIHDASSHFKVVREAALRMEHEGLLSVCLLSTPRGLVIAQRQQGRK